MMRPIVMLATFLIVVGSVNADNKPLLHTDASQRGHQQTTSKADTSKNIDNQRGTESSPAFVKVLPGEKSAAELQHEKYQYLEKPTLEKGVAWGTIALAVVTAILAFFTYGLWSDARKSANRNMADMRDSINEAVRSANAMELLARNSAESVATLKEVTAKQMRAYLMVVIGTAVYQDRANGLKFEAKPFVVNTGHTPAHKVAFKVKAAILPGTLPLDFNFPLLDHFMAGGVIGPQQNRVISGVVDDFCDDAAVDDIKHAKGDGKVLHVWGIVQYEDIFNVPHYTRFFHSVTWVGPSNQEQILGYYMPTFNDAT